MTAQHSMDGFALCCKQTYFCLPSHFPHLQVPEMPADHTRDSWLMSMKKWQLCPTRAASNTPARIGITSIPPAAAAAPLSGLIQHAALHYLISHHHAPHYTTLHYSSIHITLKIFWKAMWGMTHP
jgi:hypothetical protein